MTSETFEQVLAAAQADGSFTPAWKKFVKTKFFVPVVRSSDDSSRDFTLHLTESPDGVLRTLLISEVRARVEQGHVGTLASLTGADVVKMLQAEAGILVALSDRAFAIARDRVAWLRKGLDAGQARAASKAQPPQPPQQPRPSAVPPASPAPLARPALPARPAAGPLDVAALRPRNVTLPKLGLDFYVPGAWTESRLPTGMRYQDEASGMVVEASGFHRPNVSMAQFMAMRLDVLRQEMRFLKRDGDSYPIDGDAWRDRIKGMATEFTGVFPGDDVESRFLLACIRTEGTLVSITVRACAALFEDNRALCKWMLGRVDISEAGAVADSALLGTSLPLLGRIARPGPRALSLAALAVVALAGAGYMLAQKSDETLARQLAAAPVYEKDVNSARFTVPDGSFSVELPGAPQEVVIPKVVRQSMGKVTIRQFKLARAGRIYMVQSIDYGKAPADPAAALIGMQSSVVGRDGEMVSARGIDLNGAMGREVRADLPGGIVRAARFALVGSKVCMIMVAVPDKPGAAAHIDAFLDSFKLGGAAAK